MKRPGSPAEHVDPTEEVSALIEALHETVQRLEDLTAGQIDSVADRHGRPLLLRRAQEQMRQREAARQNGILNALPAHIALIDAHGIIISTNEGWQRFARDNDGQHPGHGVGLDYLAICDAAKGDDADDAQRAAAGIRSVLAGTANAFTMEYPCHSPNEQRWFVLSATPLVEDRLSGAVVMHQDVTQRKQHDEALRRFRAAMDATGDAIFLTDLDTRRFIEINATACVMLGYTREELLAMGPAQLSPDLEHRDVAEDSMLNGSSAGQLVETEVQRKDGTAIQVEVHRHVQSLEGQSIVVGVLHDITERKEAEKRLHHMAHYDALTGMPNRTLFFDTLKKTLTQAAESGWLVAVLFIDLDHFKVINDTLGHTAGDELLIQASNRLMQCVRIRDTVGRLGGDEFALILVMQDDQQGAWLAAKKVRDVLRLPFSIEGRPVSVTASIGITIYPDDAADPATLLRYADTAMYSAKHAGRDTFRFFTAQMNVEVLARLEMETALREAIENDEFVLHYQPKVQLASGRVAGLEALLRWQRPGHGLVSPADFIPVLEETGLIVRVGSWVIASVCKQIALWQNSEIGPVQVSVNVAGRQLVDTDLDAEVSTALHDNGVSADLLELELTESTLMANTERTVGMLQSLRARGVQISIDDFGTGYSSLAYLRHFPIDKLKIDITFIRDVTISPGDAAIVLAIIDMAHRLKLDVIAEGVETAAQVAYLRRKGCDQIQGYYFSRPLPLRELETLLLEKGRSPALADQPAVSPKTLLLVDDELHVMASLQRLLRPDGYHILTARSAAEAFDLLAQYPVQVIVCDQRMPGMSGTAFLSRVKEMYPDTFRIVLTAYTDIDSILEAVNGGAIYRFYTKPWVNKVFRDNMRETFQHHALLHGTQPAGAPRTE